MNWLRPRPLANSWRGPPWVSRTMGVRARDPSPEAARAAAGAIATVTVIHAIGIWNELILATIYLTDENTYPITRGLIVFEGVYGSDWPKLAAAVLMLMMPMLALYMFLQRYIISGLTSGAIKG